jgi:hypothetical protein
VPQVDFRILARRAFRIAGQEPKVEWTRNTGGVKRTIRQAVAIAKKHGVFIPADVIFFQAESGDLEGTWQDLFSDRGMETARGPVVYEHPDGYVYWQDHYNIFGRIPFLVHPDILGSDEAIVAVFEHEMFEPSRLREVFLSSRDHRMSATDYGLQVATNRPGNFHDLAWNAADEIVLRMRKGKS